MCLRFSLGIDYSLEGVTSTTPELVIKHREVPIAPLEDNKSRVYCYIKSIPTVIRLDYNMIKQLGIKLLLDKLRSKFLQNRARSPTIPSRRVREHEERRQACKTVSS